MPAKTVIEATTVAALELLDSLMTMPPDGAGPDRVTEPVVGVPPTTLLIDNVNDDKTGGSSSKVADWVSVPSLAVTRTPSSTATPFVVAVNLALDEPARIVTEAGTVTLGEVLVSLTTSPPLGANPFRATVPEVDVPPVTVDGLKFNDASAIGVNVRVAVFEVVPSVAVIVTTVCDVTEEAEIVNVAVD